MLFIRPRQPSPIHSFTLSIPAIRPLYHHHFAQRRGFEFPEAAPDFFLEGVADFALANEVAGEAGVTDELLHPGRVAPTTKADPI